LRVPLSDQGAQACLIVVQNNAEGGVTWIHSHVSEDLNKSFCVYDGPSPDAIREVAGRNNQPIDAITPVRVLDPYFYRR
jgi:hypothetical protein